MSVGFRTVFALAALLLCLNSASALNFNNICALLTNGAKIASGDSCTSYYVCNNNIATLYTCPGGNSFSKDNQQCLPASQVNCNAVGEDPCAGRTIGSFVPVPGSCSGFYYCSANGALRSNCPLGENFNPTYPGSCEYASKLPCNPTSSPDNGSGQEVINLCTYIQNGVYFGSPSSCSGWNICRNNVMIAGECNSTLGLEYNVLISKCDYSQNVACNQVTNDPDLIGGITSGGSCSVSGNKKNGTTCNSYYLCNGNTYVLQKCADGLYYDTVSQTCVNRLNARNPCNRCLGTTKSFVNSYSATNCSGWVYCLDGVQNNTGNCLANYSFNEVLGACIEGEPPNFGCCNPNATITTIFSNSIDDVRANSVDAKSHMFKLQGDVEASDVRANSVDAKSHMFKSQGDVEANFFYKFL